MKDPLDEPQDCVKCNAVYTVRHFIKKRKCKDRDYAILKHCRKCQYQQKKERNKDKLLEHFFVPTPKTCPVCNNVKDRSSFSFHSSNHDGRRAWCKECDNRKRWMAKFKKFGAGESHWQHYCATTHCQCCGTEFQGRGYSKKCQDHDHYRMTLRGVICNQCNLLEGYVAWGETRANKPEEQRRIECLRNYIREWDKGNAGDKQPTSMS